MARKKPNLLEDFIEVAAMLPWWAGVTLAPAAYFLLHQFAGPVQVGQLSSLQGLNGVVVNGMVSVACYFGQYLVPGALLIGAALSAYRNKRSKALLESARATAESNRLTGFSWQEFETIVGQSFRERGFHVIERGGGGADGGIDLELRMGKDKYLVQCKHWKTRAVGVAVVRELYGVMSAEGAVGGFVVASGKFTPDAAAFAKGRSVELVDAIALARRSRATTRPMNAKGAPVCPRCGGGMVRRAARRGTHTGVPFWGCSNYPECRGIVNDAQ